MVLTILRNIQYLGRQGLAFRGNAEEGNFDQLMQLSAKIDPRVKNINQSPYYSIMADEVTDSSNIEQLVLCFRWIELHVHEDYVGIHAIENIKSGTILAVIKDVLKRFNIPLSNCRGQCYDGASNMTGHKKGVSTQILEESPFAFLTHCFEFSRW